MTIEPTPIDEEPVAGGWAAFAGTALALAGVIRLIWGVAALSDSSLFIPRGPLWLSLETWGWLVLALGVLQLLGAGLIVARRQAGAVLALFLGLGGALAAFATIGAYPLWSVIVLSVDVLMVWAVTAHGVQFVR